MKAKTVLSQIVIFFLLTSCSNDSKGFLGLFKIEEEINLETINEAYVDSVGRPEIIFSHNKNILIADPIMPKLLLNYNASDKTITRIFQKGLGRTELCSIHNIGHGRNNEEVFIYDLTAHSVYFLSPFTQCVEKDVQIKPERFCDVAYDNDLAFFLAIGEDKRFGLRYNNAISYFGDNISLDGLTPKVVSNILQGLCLLSSTNKKITWFSVYGDILEIYDYSNIDSIKLVKSHVSRLPLYDRYNGAMDIKSNFGIQSVTTDDNYIYAVYNGKTLQEMVQNKEEAFYTDMILVFDWNGNPIKVLKLNGLIRSITYDKIGNQIICIGLNDDSDNAIYSIPL